MDYHQPDERWEIFGNRNYEDYLAQCLVKGKFHPSVPDDVKEAYMLVEYIMAHAYYHYPLYDEATSKVLRIMEMAVKLRCKKENIILVTERTNKKTGHLQEKNLNTLIKELSAIDTSKGLALELVHIKDIRNIFMHPDKHSYSGIITKQVIKNSIVLFNKLFIHDDIFKASNKMLKKEQDKAIHFRQAATIVDFNNERYLLHNTTIADCLQIDNVWLYCICCQPIASIKSEHGRKHSYIKSFTFIVKDLNIQKDFITATELKSNTSLTISLARHNKDILVYDQFQKSLKNDNDRCWYEHHCDDELAEQITEFNYV